MFGLENQKSNKKKGAEEFVFDLEHQLKIGKNREEIKRHVENRIQQIKDVLRGGENKEEFDRYGVLLHGYASLLRVISRFAKK